MTAELQALSERFGAACVDLAMLASPASRVEPELLATLRRRLAPHLGADTEGALWFSGLVEVYGVDGIVLAVAYRRILEQALLFDPRAEAAWEVIGARHARLSPALKVEEVANWHATRLECLPLSDEDRRREHEQLELALAPVLKAVYAGGREARLAGWLRRAWPEFHQRARGLGVMRALTNLLSVRGETAPRAAAGEPYRDFLGRFGSLFDTGARRLVQVRREGAELVLGGPAEKGGRCIQVPDTTPCEVGVEWDTNGRLHREVAVLDPTGEVRVKVGLGPVRLTALDGAVYDPSAESAQSGSPPEDFLGAWPAPGGTHFRLWLPHAPSVEVWVSSAATPVTERATPTTPVSRRAPLTASAQGLWSGFVPEVQVGDRYRYRVGLTARTPTSAAAPPEPLRVDPCARAVTAGVEQGIVTRRVRARAPDGFRPVPREELVLYELHLGSFAVEGTPPQGGFDAAARRLSHLRSLGVNGILLLPVHTCSGPSSWGFDPLHLYAVACYYGGPEAFRRFVRKAHAHELAVILNVCLSHASPASELQRFDVAPPDRESSVYIAGKNLGPPGPWGPRYNTAEPMVARYLRENALLWLTEYGVDGIQWDELSELTHVGEMSPAGIQLVSQTNREVRAQFPQALILAEDFTVARGRGSHHLPELGIDGYCDGRFLDEVRRFLTQPFDEARDLPSLAQALLRDAGDKVRRLLYLESPNEAGVARPRLPVEIDSTNSASIYAWKRSLLGAVLLLTANGIPMLFQGQEFLEDGPFLAEPKPLDWAKRTRHAGFLRAIADLVRLRTNRDAQTRGLTGSGTNVLWQDDQNKVIAYHRFHQEATGDSGVFVVVNGANRHHELYPLSFPLPGRWEARFHSENRAYRSDAEDFTAETVLARPSGTGYPTGTVRLAPYSAVIYLRTGDASSERQVPGAEAAASAERTAKADGTKDEETAQAKAPPRPLRAELLLAGPDGKPKELPFIIGVLADLSGQPAQPLPPPSQRQFVEVEAGDLRALFQQARPRLTLHVRYLIANDHDELAVAIEFQELDHFRPDRVAERVPPLRRLLQERERLAAVRDAVADPERGKQVLEALSRSEVEPVAPLQSPLPRPSDTPTPSAGDQPGEGARSSETAGIPLLADIESGLPASTRSRLEGLFHWFAVNPDQFVPSQGGRKAETIESSSHRERRKRVVGAHRTEMLAAIEAYLGELDKRLSRQVDAIIHHPEFVRLEGSWRGLLHLVTATRSLPNVKVEVLNLSLAELRESFGPPYFIPEKTEQGQDSITRRCRAGVEREDGEPLACVLGDYEFDHSKEDVALLGRLAELCSTAYAPLLTGASPRLFGWQSWREPARASPELLHVGHGPGYVDWNVLRGGFAAPYLVLTLPRILARLPYGRATNPIEGFAYEEAVESHPEAVAAGGEANLVWTASAYALAENLARSFAETGLCLRIQGESGGGIVEEWPVWARTDEGGRGLIKSPTEARFSREAEQALGALGLTPLSHSARANTAAFLSANTVQRPARHEDAEGTASAVLSAQLSHVLLISRFAQYLAKMLYTSIGKILTVEDTERELNGWLAQYVSHPSSADPVKRAKPLVEGRAEITAIEDRPGHFDARLHLRPHDYPAVFRTDLGSFPRRAYQ